MVSSLFQIVIGFSGFVGLIVRFVSPLAIAPTIALIGLSLFSASNTFAGKLKELLIFMNIGSSKVEVLTLRAESSYVEFSLEEENRMDVFREKLILKVDVPAIFSYRYVNQLRIDLYFHIDMLINLRST